LEGERDMSAQKAMPPIESPPADISLGKSNPFFPFDRHILHCPCCCCCCRCRCRCRYCHCCCVFPSSAVVPYSSPMKSPPGSEGEKRKKKKNPLPRKKKGSIT
jgi:hypothetical protein